jgi:hypothetical protein
MSLMLRRLLTICLAATFFVGATVHILRPSTAMADAGAQTDKMGDCDHEMAECCQPARSTKHLPNCFGHLGCLTVPALAVSPSALPMPFDWTSVAYVSRASSLLGQSVEPELSPPILVV